MKEGVPADHPRAESLRIREKLIENFRMGVVAIAGLMAHGRGEAFDYLLGEETTESALRAIRAAAAAMLLAERPVISVNGNVAALVAEDVVRLAEATGAKIEVNLFYRTWEREQAIKRVLEEAGAKEVLGVGDAASARIPEVCSERRRVDPRGILTADVVLVPLEDGDRAEALRRMGKVVIAVDLNPLSRTARAASITIVDNVVRALPLLVQEAYRLRGERPEVLKEIVSGFDNGEALSDAVRIINERLSRIAGEGACIPEGAEVYRRLEGEER
jgi:4-phosphopantoate--beta-alanine ligase